MAKSYYEVHITLLGLPSDLKRKVEALNWTFSSINGDPNLGTGIKCYAIRQYNIKLSLPAIIAKLEETAANFPASQVLRKKVELVVYDSCGDRVKERGKI